MSDEMDEIWELYADDGAQALDAMEAALLTLQEGDAADPSVQIGALFRAVHTFKGNSRVLGLAVVENRAHLSEDLIGLVRDRGVPLTSEIVDVLMLSCDTLRGMLEETASTRADVAPEPSEVLTERLQEMISACTARLEGGAVGEGEGDGAAPAAPIPSPLDASVFDVFDDVDDTDDAGDGAGPEAAPLDAPADPDAVTAEDAAPSPESAVEAAPAAGEAEPKPAAPRLCDDPTYRDIFIGMANEAIGKLDALLAAGGDELGAQSAKQADQLGYAAGQMGLDDWQARLDAFVQQIKGGGDASADIPVLLADLRALLDRGIGASAVPSADEGQDAAETDVLAAMQEYYGAVAELGLGFAEGSTPDPARQAELADAIRALAVADGYVRLDAAATELGAAVDAAGYRRAELQLYEELASIERVKPARGGEEFIAPSALLETWCADHIYDVLGELRKILDKLRKDYDREAHFAEFERQMRFVYHACSHFRMETAAQLTMALVDLFSRVRVGGDMPDAMLTHIARGFLDTLELVFDALDQGDTPDMEAINQLFEEASNACFVSSGLVTARTIEKRLGLPEAFHRVLSPESVREAQAAIDEKLSFYIVRADLNQDQAKAEAFLDWIGAGEAKMITNVTVFTETDVVFDFLLASRRDSSELVEALATIDASGKNLSLMQALAAGSEEDAEAAAPSAEDVPTETLAAPASIGNTIQLIEMIGEMAAGQAMVQHMLSAVAARDLVHEIELALREAGVERVDPTVWRALRDRLDDYGDAITQVADAEAQLSEQVTRIQEAGVALRSRPAQALLQSLAAFVETRSRAQGCEARLSSEGGDITLDQTILEEMRAHLKALLTMRIASGTAPTRFHVAVLREDDGVVLTLEDNGGAQDDDAVVAEIAAELAARSGSLRVATPPTGGMRFHLMLPLNMVVLDGMVVRVSEVNYVVPLESIQRIQQCKPADVLTISAGGGAQMLRLSEGEHVPIHSLHGANIAGRPATGAGAAPAPQKATDERIYVIVRSASRQIALPVDELLGQQMVLLRPLRGVLSGMRGLTGIALLAGGDVGMVLSVSRLQAA
ncbi:chemotaxis protein CheA [Meridianimarinicoccus roseus]|uniref:histidine kinase n=1 Tax=Meridianimarinicoccus roseus TaxID=2072018 RepID=A0A2V2LAT0_9RHOB|nr:Hpt domain-containing protein [Meridianimarinicoccus roseus]PWR02590.1 chemotaxis protein CheA [Meridianimarinicoccus roseus]